MSLDRFELLELRRDDGIQTFHARELATARPVQVHLFVQQGEDALLSRMDRLPDAERRRVVDRGVAAGKPYVVTDRLAGFASFREWLESKAVLSLDEQFLNLFESAEPGKVPATETKKLPTRSIRFGAKAVLAVVLGVAAALAFLALAMAVFAFHLW